MHCLPKCWDGCAVLVHSDGKAVNLVVIFHVEEGIGVYVAVEVDVRSGKQSASVDCHALIAISTHSTRQYHL